MIKKVLIISYHFLPVTNMPTMRLLRFLKYLKQFGWQIVILTTKLNAENYAETNDKSLLNIVKGIRVYGAHYIGPEIFLHKRSLFENDSTIAPRQLDRRISKSLKNLTRAFLYNYLFEREIGWLPFAFVKGIRVMKRQNIELIYTSGPPFTTNLIGYLLKKISTARLIVEVRDIVYDDVWRDFKYSYVGKAILQYVAGKIIRNADYVVTASEGIKKHLLRRNRIRKDKIKVIYNAFDLPAKIENKSNPFSHRINIVYTGELYGPRVISPFLHALKELATRHPNMGRKILFHFAGVCHNENFQRIVDSLSIKENAKYYGFVAQSEVANLHNIADIFLLVKAPNDKISIPGKLFEYLGVKKPILALVPSDSEAANIIIRSQSGIITSPNNIQDIVKGLKLIVKSYKNGDFYSNKYFQNYNALNLTKKLEGIFYKVVNERKLSI